MSTKTIFLKDKHYSKKQQSVGSEISSHSVCKMSSVFGTFANRLCEVIYERSQSRGTTSFSSVSSSFYPSNWRGDILPNVYFARMC